MTAGDVTRYNSRCAAGHGGVAYVAAEIITKLVQKSTGTAAWARGENDMLSNLQMTICMKIFRFKLVLVEYNNKENIDYTT